MKFLIRWLSIGLAVAFVLWMPGLGVGTQGSFVWTVVVVSAILGLVNATIGAILKFLSFPLRVLTLGLFTVIINALMLQLSFRLSNALFGTDLYIKSFGWAMLASILISIVTAIMWGLFSGDDKKKD